MPDDRLEAGLEFLRQYQPAEEVQAMLERLKARSPRFAEYSIASSYGDVYTRDGLEMKLRELVTIAIISALGATENQIRIHTELGIRMGLTATEIVEAVIQVGAYAGAPKASAAMIGVTAGLANAGVDVP